jgi:hypothetical protein|tara:strand:- start:29 stop:484 length:456 start_codon:yes stop_codon:yes gene_type:complete
MLHNTKGDPMDPENKKVDVGHNSNRSITEDALRDALTIAVKTIAKFSKSGEAISNSLFNLNNAKNNWERGKHADAATKNAEKLSKDLHPFRCVLQTLKHKEDMYGPYNKEHTLELGGTYSNFGMHFANDEKELSDAVIEAEKQWSEEDKDE